ncbi:Curli production assembly/transport component CsgG [Gemmatirosa kalamazoonensis]|uniref:Curli production assembly/transport component CsgG n=1 Tax=Gemmatirosa kalamazoonensis TaxID=861299 RepID=W0RE00_9BACT|nr:CsgG/HfaB family protein [Gemmatirosa kalamazoonensis]AHG89036.1 Curli production assembly/transport component CsgG [Gemmatirosa kalamazoonensis]
MRPSPMFRWSRRITLALALAAPAVLAGQPVTKAQPADSGRVRTVAVLYFDNNSGRTDYDPLGRGISAMLITDLSAVPQIRLVERERLQNVLAEQQLQQLSMFDPATAVRAGKLLGAEYLLTGAFSAVDPQMRIDTRVIRVETGEIVRTAKVQGNADDFFKLQQKLAHELVSALPIALSPASLDSLQKQQQRNRIDDARVIVDFAAGLVRLDNRDYVGAVEKLAPALTRSHDALVVQLAYDEAKKRASASAKQSAKDKVRSGLRGLLKRP